MAFNNTLSIGSATYERLDNGFWIDSSTTADQPRYLQLKSRVKPDGLSDYLVKITTSKNSLVPGASDDQLSTHLVIKAPVKVFTQAEIEAQITALTTFLSSANLTKLMRGER